MNLAGDTGPIAVIGLWHLGSVTAACLAEAGHQVIGIDPDPGVVERLSRGRPPVSEPGLQELMEPHGARLRFTVSRGELAAARRAWVTFDTPVNDDDEADVEWVLERATELLGGLPEGALVIVSAQLPVGSVARLEARCAAQHPGQHLRFACVPENLRLGSALESFRAPERIVIGVRCEEDRRELGELLGSFGGERQWMAVESAEMTKHALNGFLATSVAFINEVATICESVGADAAEVSRGLKSERRIGPRAYLGPGEAFAGGTLARDITFLRELAQDHGLSDRVFAGVAEANRAHRRWTRRKLTELLGHDGSGNGVASADGSEDGVVPADGSGGGVASAGGPGDGVVRAGGSTAISLAGRTVAIWGLTYKPGTDTLRRSSAVELCHWLLGVGARVRAHDPKVQELPAELEGTVVLCSSALEAVRGADVLVVCTAWPEYREVALEEALMGMRQRVVLDPAGWLRGGFPVKADVRYLCVGTPASVRVRPPGMTPAEIL